MRPIDVSSVRVKIVRVLAVAMTFAAAGCDSIAAPGQTTVAVPTETTIAAPTETTTAAPPETTVAAPPEATSAALAKAVAEGRLTTALRIYAALEKPDGDDEFLVGRALMDLHRPGDAVAHLSAAKDRFIGTDKWTAPDPLLVRVADVLIFAPPESPTTEASIEVHAGPRMGWNQQVLYAVPSIADVGRRIFGADLPHARLYLFDERARFDRFEAALFGEGACFPWAIGTGAPNVAVCRTFGKDAIAVSLHELTHAWISTYLMDRYDRQWALPPWLDEGLAEYAVSLREPAYLDRCMAPLKERAKGEAAPRFIDMSDSRRFYRTVDVELRGTHYLAAMVLVAELLGPRDEAPAKIRAILDGIGRTGDVDASIKAATGKDVRKTFDYVVRRWWP